MTTEHFTTSLLKRRDLLAGAAALFVRGATADGARSLKGLGQSKGILFGCAIGAHQLSSYPALGTAIARDCAIVVPENDMKWGATEPIRGKPTYKAAEAVADFANSYGITLRGHPAIWYRNIPPWAEHAIEQPGGHHLIISRIREIVGHFKGRVVEWDVVNEMIDHTSGRADGMRNWPPFAPGDPGFIADCFFAARETDPHSRLVYNDFGFEYVSSGEDQRRKAAVSLMQDLMKRGAPIDGFGIQSHLKVGNNFNPRIFRQFLGDIAATGLHISITELDIDDQRLSADIGERDAAIKAHGKLFLATALDEPAVRTVLTWGFSNRFSWLNAQRPRTDGIPHRPLPLDENMQPTPLWNAIAESLKNAPERR